MFNLFYIFKNRNFRPSVERGSTEYTSANVQTILYGMVLVFFITIAIFGTLVVSYHMNGNCFSSIIGSENCPGKGFAEIDHHLALPHIFSEVIPNNFSIFSFLLPVLSIIALFIIFIKSAIQSTNRLSFARKRNEAPFSSISPMIISWLSRFENSPNFL